MTGIKGMIGHKSLKVDEMVRLHLIEGLSTSKIATLLNMKKNSVIQSLRYRKVLRKAQGRDIEEKVAQWFENKGRVVKRQRGDAPFDMTVDTIRIEVKSSHISQNSGYPRYQFELQHKGSTIKDWNKEADLLLLVFLDEEDTPIYGLMSGDVPVQGRISMNGPLASKHNLFLYGFLEK